MNEQNASLATLNGDVNKIFRSLVSRTAGRHGIVEDGGSSYVVRNVIERRGCQADFAKDRRSRKALQALQDKRKVMTDAEALRVVKMKFCYALKKKVAPAIAPPVPDFSKMSEAHATTAIWNYLRRDVGRQADFLAWFSVVLLLEIESWLSLTLVRRLLYLKRSMYETDWGAGKFLTMLDDTLPGFIFTHSLQSLDKPKYDGDVNRKRITFLYQCLFRSSVGQDMDDHLRLNRLSHGHAGFLSFNGCEIRKYGNTFMPKYPNKKNAVTAEETLARLKVSGNVEIV